MAELSMDDFLTHRTSGGGKTAYLGSWKKREKTNRCPAHAVDVWLHTRATIHCVWRHQLPQIVVREDRETKKITREVWSENLVCWESEETLRAQNKRDDDGNRKHPPERCPICKLVEHVRRLVREGELSWTDEVFVFEGTTETKVIRAGGLFNAFGAQDLTNEEKAELRACKINPREAWQQNAQAKANYIFRVVDHAFPEKGVQVAIEPGLLGDKVRTVIKDVMDNKAAAGLDPQQGNPLRNPYAIRWVHDPADGIEFSKKYHAKALPDLRPDDEVLRLITETDAPSIDHLTQRFNAATVRAALEKHCRIDLPWDQLFGAAQPEPEAKPAGKSSGGAAPKAREPEPPGEEMFACDECDKPMRADASKCPHCGHQYDVEQAAVPTPPPLPKLPKRSEVKARRAQAASSVVTSAPPLDEPEMDDVPF